MIGFEGVRRVEKRGDNLLEQHITLRTPEQKAHWAAIFPAPKKFKAGEFFPVTVRWIAEMMLFLGDRNHLLQLQSTKERDEWRQVFPQHPNIQAVASWSAPPLDAKALADNTPVVLILTSRQKAGAEAVETDPEKTFELSALTDKQLRTKAAELEIEFEEDEQVDGLRAKVREKLLAAGFMVL